MKNKIKLFLLLSSIFVMAYWSSCTPDDVKPPISCSVLYPKDGDIIDTSVFYFQWCAVDGATEYRIQAEGTKFFPYAFDTIVKGTTAKSVLVLPVSNNPNMTWEWSPFDWGHTYQWRVAPIIDGVQGEWSETYEFKTWDARDKFVGVYSGNKYIFKVSLFGNFYLDSAIGTGQIKVEKVENSSNKIRITEIGGDNMSAELENFGYSDYWWKLYNVHPNSARFYEQTDSFQFEFMTNPGDHIPWGYYFGGHY